MAKAKHILCEHFAMRKMPLIQPFIIRTFIKTVS